MEETPVATTEGAARPGPDGRHRCLWALNSDDELRYHDAEWGYPVQDDQAMFERICLEGFQAGLSWLTVLRKRAALREVFQNFDIATVAGYGPEDVTRLLGDARIIRSRPKIEAVVANARAALEIPGGLAGFVWSYAPAPSSAPVTVGDLSAATSESTALAKALKRHGFRFVGPTTAYATMQATGIVDDHLAGCYRRGDSTPQPSA
ncbi:DNA-3-methyladenine glycosylase I [Salinactinospora qingdaonensis]|uniref:DNA-3-methyladenine glycosylase I n=1 Tax=Salinactinospora qingdaonensis TaxID=702744 RepID=A0ABP7FM74_9ACTN